MSREYPRDLRGYGAAPPDAGWPGDARIAVQFVVNYEEGAENCVLHGDLASETFLSEIVGAAACEGARHMNMESLYEYGARAGFWRLHRMFTGRNLPVTVFGVAMALERNPDVVAAMKSADWEIASHGYRWIDYQNVDEATELEHLQKAIDIHERATGERPAGWYLGRCSPNSHRLPRNMAGSPTTPTVTRTMSLTGITRLPSRSSWCHTHSMRTTCASQRRRGSTRAHSSTST